MIRAFAALALPDPVRFDLMILQQGLPVPRPVPPESLHLTLVFLGELPGRLLEDVDLAFRAVAAPGFELALAGIDLFGGARPRLAYVGARPNPALHHLQAKVETAARGVIYEHRPTSIPAARLAAALKPLLGEAAARGGSSFERDAAVVLRRVAEAAREAAAATPGSGRAYLDFLARLEARHDSEREAGRARGDDPAAGDDRSRLIVP